ncbi:Dyp-type peroxidase [Paraburkholderia nodosa]|uniref:Dyp-type peroxidase n=1 Tax=Paraburkholderia nodosa TaxID=392320 RepID=UPI0008418149|nr:Dyp-type peroxidase [Paraburkholderia nodosa]
MSRNLSDEPLLPTNDIQGDILAGLIKQNEHLLFFKISDVKRFKTFLRSLHLTSVDEVLAQDEMIRKSRNGTGRKLLPTPGLNIAFTFSGLSVLGIRDIDPGSAKAFIEGMGKRADQMTDPPTTSWTILRPDANLHGVFVVTGASHAEVADIISLRLAPPNENGWTLLHTEEGQVRPAPVAGHEHFGYADGVSQPGVKGRTSANVALTPTATGADPSQGQKGQDLLWPGEFVFGFPGQNPQAASLEVKGDDIKPPSPFMENGAYLVFRRLAQKVPEFNRSVKLAAQSITSAANPMNPDLLGAQMVGRWKSGAAIIKAPLVDNPTIADGTPDVNDFEFDGDRQGFKCPFAAHIRKAYPRDDVPGKPNVKDKKEIDAAEAFTQSHRMLRRGIAFGPEVTEEEALNEQSAGGDKTRGLLFKCYITSIENQFEFVQQSWANNVNFSQPESGIDPIIGQSHETHRFFAGAAPQSLQQSDKPQLELESFVTLEGGAYFFAPSIRKLRGIV